MCGPGRRRNGRRRARRCRGAALGRRRRPETRRQRRRGHPLACWSVARLHLHPRLRSQEGGRRRVSPRACGTWCGGCGPRQPQSRRRARGFGFPRMPSPGHDCSVAFRRREGRCCSNLSEAASGIAPPSAGRCLAAGAADKGWRDTLSPRSMALTFSSDSLGCLHLVFGTPLRVTAREHIDHAARSSAGAANGVVRCITIHQLSCFPRLGGKILNQVPSVSASLARAATHARRKTGAERDRQRRTPQGHIGASGVASGS